MEELELMYPDAASIPEGVEGLYTETDGKFHLTGIRGMKTQGDIDRLTSSLGKERTAHTDTKAKWKPMQDFFGDRSVEDVQAVLDEVDELRMKVEAAGGEFPQEKIDQLVTQRAAREKAPLERQLKTLGDELAGMRGNFEKASGELTRRDLHSHLREIGEKAKIRPEAMEDWLSMGERIFDKQEDGTWVSKDNSGVTPGVTADITLGDLQARRPHWWPESVGGGAQGTRGGGGLGGSGNPWSKAGWSLTNQGAYAREHGMEKAANAAKAVGSFIGATGPAES